MLDAAVGLPRALAPDAGDDGFHREPIGIGGAFVSEIVTQDFGLDAQAAGTIARPTQNLYALISTERHGTQMPSDLVRHQKYTRLAS